MPSPYLPPGSEAAYEAFIGVDECPIYGNHEWRDRRHYEDGVPGVHQECKCGAIKCQTEDCENVVEECGELCEECGK